MLTVSGLTTSYGSTSAVLDHVDLEVPDGEVVAVLGSNGAGKSTLLRAISGTLPMHGGTVHEGNIELDGKPLHRKPADITRAGVVQAPEGRQVFARMSVEENLRVGGLSPRLAVRRPASGSSTCSPYSRSGAASAPASSPVANSRCSPSAGP